MTWVSWIKLSWVPEGFSRAGWNIYKSAQFPPKPRAAKERDNIEDLTETGNRA